MLSIVAKKYNFLFQHNPLHTFSISSKKPKSIHDLFGTKSLLKTNDKKPNSDLIEDSVDAESANKSTIQLKLRDKLKQDRIKTNTLKSQGLYDQYFVLQQSQQSSLIDEKWYGDQTNSAIELDEMVEQKIHSIIGENNIFKSKILKFDKNLNISIKMQNSTKFTETLACLLQQKKYFELISLLRKFTNEGGCSQGLPKSMVKQKQLFKNVRKLLCKCIQDQDCVNEIMQLFSKCNPKFIELGQFKKVRELQHYNSGIPYEKQTVKLDMMQNFGQFLAQALPKDKLKKEHRTELIDELQKNDRLKSSQILELIQSLDEEDKLVRNRSKPIKLFLKKQASQTSGFQPDENNLQKVEKKIFGNKKLVTQQIIIKRVGNRTNDKMNNFGENWVYSYQLPYDVSKADAGNIISCIESKYGEVVEYTIHPYRRMIEKYEDQIIYVIPDNFKQDSKKSREKIQIVKMSEMNLENLVKIPKKKTLTTKILEKTKKTKQLNLNKSYMLFKFKRREDKDKFLNPEMRLFGINFNQFKNIKFQDAQSKSMIALTMVPWGCESQDIIKLLNDVLLPLKITVTHPNCLIAKSYIFVQLANFYETFYAKDLLNNYIFQNQRLKCQIVYGATQIREGEFKQSLEANHYETLVQKLGNLRSFYDQFHS